MDNLVHSDYYEAESFWAGDALKDPGNIRRIDFTVEMLPPNTRSLLDVGCGNGVFGHRVMEMHPDIEITGVDRSKAALRHVRFSNHAASIDNLPFEDMSFDVVSCLQVIEHLPNEVYRKSLHELSRVSRRHVIIGIPFEEDLTAETTQCPQCRTIFNINFHLRSYNLLDVKDLLSDFGFAMVAHGFPVAKLRTKYLNEIVSTLRRTPKQAGFLSPVCPVCSYSEGDKTALNTNTTHTATAIGNNPLPKRVAKGMLRVASAMLPKEEVKGYWIVALYERS